MNTQIKIVKRMRLPLALIIAVLLAACRAGTDARSDPQETIPAGTYSATFTAADNIRVGNAFVTGESSIAFTADGDFTIVAPEVVIRGEYTVTGDQVKFEESNPSFPCESQPVYVYRWKLEGDELSFSTVDDPCSLREMAMTIHPYVREE